ncbi:MAG: transpeptidase family protein [Candidatus Adiutrix sp.]|jgi:cell division protein FtsI (penicillin-binding protein 3)|nr:transpeptidase family protein [Candidatus Adiutrix sp.]
MSSERGQWMNIKLKMIVVVFVLIFAAVVYKSFALAVTDRDYLMGKANREIERNMKLGAVRGEIFDINGERLAASVEAPTLWADPALIQDKEETVRQLAEILNLNEKEQAKLGGSLGGRQRFVYIKRHMSEEEALAVRNLNIRGLGFKKEYRRTYPNGPLASQLLGFVGLDSEGLEGLEKALDERLRPGQDKIKVKRDNVDRIMVDNIEGELEQTRGGSVVLTIDRRIQHIAEKALSRAVGTYQAASGLALVMRPKTGAVLAAAVAVNGESFDPNNFSLSDPAARRNRILTDTFEPGSTFKIFVVAAALEEGLVTPGTVVYCENGAFKVGRHTVRDTHNYGDLTISEVIKHSSNIGSLKVGGILGNDLLYNYLTRFSFGEKTGLAHLPGEDSGLLRHPKRWYQIDAANIAFGQGVSVTALQMVMAMSSLANDGVLMKPYIVDRVLDADGRIVEQYEPHILRQVVSPLTARQVAAMLRMAVQKGGTATRAEVEGYPVAGKTGTAQKVSRGGKTYAAGKYVASFLGFAPYHNPELCVMVVLDEPRNGYYGGTVAAPAFREIMREALPILDIPPIEGPVDPVWPILQRNAGGAPGVVAGGQSNNFIRVRLKKGDRGRKGPITYASLSPEKALSAGISEPVFADVGLGLTVEPGVMPNLTGLSMRQVVEVMSEYGLDLEFAGSGHAVGQEPGPGTAVAAGQTGSIYFER